MDNTTVCRHTIAKIFKAIRMVCSIALNKKEIRLGGENLTVQIDESLFAKVKHFVGKDLARKQVWVFGMVDVKPDVIYFECVPDRTALTLLSIIYEHVVPDTTVNSDCWASYNKISLLHQSRIKHQTVNHKYNFVDPTSSTHTNKIESKWCVAKVKFNELIVKYFVRNSNNKCIKIIDLNKSGRRVLHTENVKLYHWSKQIDDKKSNFFVSNRNNDEFLHQKAQKAFFKKTKTMNDRILEIDNQLSDIQLSTCRQNKALQIERDALTGHSVSAETTAYINNIIASQPEQSIKEKKPRGRPKKLKRQ